MHRNKKNLSKSYIPEQVYVNKLCDKNIKLFDFCTKFDGTTINNQEIFSRNRQIEPYEKNNKKTLHQIHSKINIFISNKAKVFQSEEISPNGLRHIKYCIIIKKPLNHVADFNETEGITHISHKIPIENLTNGKNELKVLISQETNVRKINYNIEGCTMSKEQNMHKLTCFKTNKYFCKQTITEENDNKDLHKVFLKDTSFKNQRKNKPKIALSIHNLLPMQITPHKRIINGSKVINYTVSFNNEKIEQYNHDKTLNSCHNHVKKKMLRDTSSSLLTLDTSYTENYLNTNRNIPLKTLFDKKVYNIHQGISGNTPGETLRLRNRKNLDKSAFSVPLDKCSNVGIYNSRRKKHRNNLEHYKLLKDTNQLSHKFRVLKPLDINELNYKDLYTESEMNRSSSNNGVINWNKNTNINLDPIFESITETDQASVYSEKMKDIHRIRDFQDTTKIIQSSFINKKEQAAVNGLKSSDSNLKQNNRMKGTECLKLCKRTSLNPNKLNKPTLQEHEKVFDNNSVDLSKGEKEKNQYKCNSKAPRKCHYSLNSFNTSLKTDESNVFTTKYTRKMNEIYTSINNTVENRNETSASFENLAKDDIVNYSSVEEMNVTYNNQQESISGKETQFNCTSNLNEMNNTKKPQKNLDLIAVPTLIKKSQMNYIPKETKYNTALKLRNVSKNHKNIGMYSNNRINNQRNTKFFTKKSTSTQIVNTTNRVSIQNENFVENKPIESKIKQHFDDIVKVQKKNNKRNKTLPTNFKKYHLKAQETNKTNYEQNINLNKLNLKVYSSKKLNIDNKKNLRCNQRAKQFIEGGNFSTLSKNDNKTSINCSFKKTKLPVLKYERKSDTSNNAMQIKKSIQTKKKDAKTVNNESTVALKTNKNNNNSDFNSNINSRGSYLTDANSAMNADNFSNKITGLKINSSKIPVRKNTTLRLNTKLKHLFASTSTGNEQKSKETISKCSFGSKTCQDNQNTISTNANAFEHNSSNTDSSMINSSLEHKSTSYDFEQERATSTLNQQEMNNCQPNLKSESGIQCDEQQSLNERNMEGELSNILQEIINISKNIKPNTNNIHQQHLIKSIETQIQSLKSIQSLQNDFLLQWCETNVENVQMKINKNCNENSIKKHLYPSSSQETNINSSGSVATHDLISDSMTTLTIKENNTDTSTSLSNDTNNLLAQITDIMQFPESSIETVSSFGNDATHDKKVKEKKLKKKFKLLNFLKKHFHKRSAKKNKLTKSDRKEEN